MLSCFCCQIYFSKSSYILGGRKEGLISELHRSSEKYFLCLKCQVRNDTVVIVKTFHTQRSSGLIPASQSTGKETCFHSALDTVIYTYIYLWRQFFCCLDLLLILNCSGEQSSVIQNWLVDVQACLHSLCARKH